jgi:hypothetical protein
MIGLSLLFIIALGVWYNFINDKIKTIVNKPEAPPKKTKNRVRGISLFLALVLFEPHVKEALSIKLFKWQDGYIGAWQLCVFIVLALLLHALIYDDNDKLDIPFLNKYIKNE